MDAHLAKPIVLPELEKTLISYALGKGPLNGQTADIKKDPQVSLSGDCDKKTGIEKGTADISLILEAAEKEDPEAQYLLGKMLLTGDGIEKDPEKGMEWLRKAAVQDHREAMFLLALEYGKIHDNAFRMWMERAEELGHPDAGKELERIFKESIEWENYAHNAIH